MSESNSSSAGCGCGGLTGAVIAAAMSWTLFHKIGWAIVALIFNWLYVIYFLTRYGFEPLKAWF